MNNQKKIVHIEFIGIDNWSRPIFKAVGKKIYYGSTFSLLPSNHVAPNDKREEVVKYFNDNESEIEYFGTSFNCEPYGGRKENIKFFIQ